MSTDNQKISDLKAQIKRKTRTLINDALGFNDRDFHVQVFILGHTNCLDMYVFVGGYENNREPINILMHEPLVPYPCNYSDPAAWQAIYKKLTDAHNKLKKLRTEQTEKHWESL